MSDAIERLAAFDPFSRGSGATRDECREYLLLDVFTDAPLTGNQLAVFTDGRGLSGEQMQRLAHELKLSETVFILPAGADGDVRVRIFTPAGELPFAGHPVLGAAIVVAAALAREQVTLETAAASVAVRVTRVDRLHSCGWMSQPLPSWRLYEKAAELLAALGVVRSGLPVEIYDNGPLHVYVELASERAVAELAPDLHALAELGELGTSCFAGAGAHWKTRMFAPALGIGEDPATGAAAGPLALHLARHGRIAFAQEIEVRQGEEIARPSLLRARVTGSSARVASVEVGGSAVLVARGEFHQIP